MSLQEVIERLQKESRLVHLGDAVCPDFFLKVYPNGHFFRGELEWGRVAFPDASPDALFIQGLLALRIFNFLHLDMGGPTSFASYVSDPDCHGAALYARGIVDFIKRISPSCDFNGIYRRKPAVFTYEPQKPPVVVHLLDAKLATGGIPPFSESNTPHSVLLLGDLDGEPVCFEKRGYQHSRFSTLRAAERAYRTSYRLYAIPDGEQ